MGKGGEEYLGGQVSFSFRINLITFALVVDGWDCLFLQ